MRKILLKRRTLWILKKIIHLDRIEVLQIKYVEKNSISMAKVHCRDENQLYIAVLLPKYVGKWLTKELTQQINDSIGYFLIISINFSCNFLMMYNDNITFPFSRYNELKIYILIDCKAIKDCITLPFVHQHKICQQNMNNIAKLWYKS